MNPDMYANGEHYHPSTVRFYADLTLQTLHSFGGA